MVFFHGRAGLVLCYFLSSSTHIITVKSNQNVMTCSNRVKVFIIADGKSHDLLYGLLER
jgi:hypothetical protein